MTKTLNSTWTEYEIPLAGADLGYILGGFGWVAAASDQQGSSAVEFYLDDIYYDLARPNDARLLVSFETLNSGQPFDMVLRNAAFLYDSSLAVFSPFWAPPTAPRPRHSGRDSLWPGERPLLHRRPNSERLSGGRHRAAVRLGSERQAQYRAHARLV